jgi:hypothetical protein
MLLTILSGKRDRSSVRPNGHANRVSGIVTTPVKAVCVLVSQDVVQKAFLGWNIF